jgi:hypothetical protein
MARLARKLAFSVALAAAATGSLSACAGEAQTTTVTLRRAAPTAKLKAFAFSEVGAQARRTCGLVPREQLAAAFAGRSSSPPPAGEPARYDANAIALLYVEEIKISPIRLQTAAYKGCLEGLESQARE